MPVLTLTTANFRREVIDNAGPVIVDFYADWCGPCKQIAPAMEALSGKWEGYVRFAKVDIEAIPRSRVATTSRPYPRFFASRTER